jgi:sporulation protein YlmC with PRC-barrel domain
MGNDRTFQAAAAEQAGAGGRMIVSDQAKGASVYTPEGNRLGRIERVMVEEATGKIASAVVSFTFGNSMGIDADEHPVPWSLLTYNPRFDGYELRIADKQMLRRDR